MDLALTYKGWYAIKPNQPNLKTHAKDKTNLTLSDIEWPTEADVPLNKTQIENMGTFLSVCWF